MNVCSFFAGMSSAECQEDIWGANPDARVAGVFAPLATTKRVDGGLLVTGKWPWSSGCLHSDWAMMGVPVVNAAGEVIDQAMAYMPMSDCTIEDTWYVAGMKGTGSNTVVAKEVFVPDHRLMSVSACMSGNAPTPYKDEVLYRCGFIPVAALILTGPMMGLVKRAARVRHREGGPSAASPTPSTPSRRSRRASSWQSPRRRCWWIRCGCTR